MCDPHATLAKAKKEIEANTYPSIPAEEQQLYPTESRKDEEYMDNYKTLFKYEHVMDQRYIWVPILEHQHHLMHILFMLKHQMVRTLTCNVTSKDDIDYVKLQIQTITNENIQ